MKIESIKLEDIVFEFKKMNENEAKRYSLRNQVVLFTFTEGKYVAQAANDYLSALKILGVKEVEGLVLKEEGVDDMISDLKKEQISPIEEAQAIQHILARCNLSQAQLAKQLGYKQSTIANKLRLLKLSSKVQQDIVSGNLSERHARALLPLNKTQQEEVADIIKRRGYNVKESENYVKGLLNENESEKPINSQTKIAINTIEKAIDLCQKNGIKTSYKQSEYAEEVELIIKIKK